MINQKKNRTKKKYSLKFSPFFGSWETLIPITPAKIYNFGLFLWTVKNLFDTKNQSFVKKL